MSEDSSKVLNKRHRRGVLAGVGTTLLGSAGCIGGIDKSDPENSSKAQGTALGTKTDSSNGRGNTTTARPASKSTISYKIEQNEEFPPVDELKKRGDPPDLLTMRNGAPVKTPEVWFEERRPEILKLAQHYIYGYLPEPISPIHEVTNQYSLFNNSATAYEVNLALPSDPSITVPMLVILPSQTPSDVFLSLSPVGMDKIRNEGWQRAYPFQYITSRGYGFATMAKTRVEADGPDESGFGAVAPKPGPEESQRGDIATWAWGLQRGVDYLKSRSDVSNVAITGGSRLGKATLLAGATYEKVDLTIPHVSGTAGTAIYRNDRGETLQQIWDRFPYWFADRYGKFVGQRDRLPIDQHCLMAAVAPRPLLSSEQTDSKWINAAGARRGVSLAAELYKYLGGNGAEFYKQEPIEASPPSLLWYQQDAGHVMNRRYWQAFMNFADYHL